MWQCLQCLQCLQRLQCLESTACTVNKPRRITILLTVMLPITTLQSRMGTRPLARSAPAVAA